VRIGSAARLGILMLLGLHAQSALAGPTYVNVQMPHGCENWDTHITCQVIADCRSNGNNWNTYKCLGRYGPTGSEDSIWFKNRYGHCYATVNTWSTGVIVETHHHTLTLKAGSPCKIAHFNGNNTYTIRFDDIKSPLMTASNNLKGVLTAERPKSEGEPSGWPGVVDNAGLQWVSIPAGSFMMGSEGGDHDQLPRHKVVLPAFQMSKTMVTNKQYKACVDAGACKPGKNYGKDFSDDDQPVVGVDWSHADAFAKWVGGSLPSEAQWEYAARGAGKDTKYPWGNEAVTCERANLAECALGKTAPVCSKPAGSTPQGICDLAGNSSEWVQDWYHDSYKGAPEDGRAWEDTGTLRVIRGGSWTDGAAASRSVDRDNFDPSERRNSLGFRTVRAAPREGRTLLQSAGPPSLQGKAMLAANSMSPSEIDEDEEEDVALLLSNATRRKLLCILVKEAAPIDLAEILGVSYAAVSAHLAKFKAYGLVSPRRDAQAIYYTLTDKGGLLAQKHCPIAE